MTTAEISIGDTVQIATSYYDYARDAADLDWNATYEVLDLTGSGAAVRVSVIIDDRIRQFDRRFIDLVAR